MVKKYKTEKREITVREFPKNLEDRANAILSSVNTEYKSATLGFFLDDDWKTSNNIRYVAESYVSFVNRIPEHSSFKKYCTSTFIPIGTVAEERIKYKGKANPVSYYKLTEDGEKYGKSIAEFSLKTAANNNLSMYEIFRQTQSSCKTRSPLSIAKILFELEKEDNLRKIDLENKIGLDDGNISEGLVNLKILGFVDYDSVSPEDHNWSQYEWIEGKKPDNALKVGSWLTLTKKVANEMQKIKISDYNELAEILDYKYTYNISTILSGLERQGFLKRKTKFKGGEKLSEASITKKGRKFVIEFLDPVYQALKDDFSSINSEIEIFDDISTTCNYISKGFKLYEEVCPAYKREAKDENKYKILQMLKNKKLRVKEINEKLGKKSNKYLKELIDEREIIKERECGVVYYSLNK